MVSGMIILKLWFENVQDAVKRRYCKCNCRFGRELEVVLQLQRVQLMTVEQRIPLVSWVQCYMFVLFNTPIRVAVYVEMFCTWLQHFVGSWSQ